MIIREYRGKDCAALAELFYETVHCVNCADYTAEQLDAWATGSVDLAEWDQSFRRNYTLVAEAEGQIVGFGDMDSNGYLDRLFVHKDYQRRGVGTALCDALEHSAETGRFTVYSSVTAKAFFEARGYEEVAKQRVARAGVSLVNYAMVKYREKALA